jgi:hypothetical protein
MASFSNSYHGRMTINKDDGKTLIVTSGINSIDLHWAHNKLNKFGIEDPNIFVQKLAEFLGYTIFYDKHKPAQVYVVKVSIPGGTQFTHAFTKYPTRGEVEKEFSESYLRLHHKEAEYLGAIREGRFEVNNYNLTLKIEN